MTAIDDDAAQLAATLSWLEAMPLAGLQDMLHEPAGIAAGLALLDFVDSLEGAGRRALWPLRE